MGSYLEWRGDLECTILSFGWEAKSWPRVAPYDVAYKSANPFYTKKFGSVQSSSLFGFGQIFDLINQRYLSLMTSQPFSDPSKGPALVKCVVISWCNLCRLQSGRAHSLITTNNKLPCFLSSTTHYFAGVSCCWQNYGRVSSVLEICVCWWFHQDIVMGGVVFLLEVRHWCLTENDIVVGTSIKHRLL